MTLLAASLVFSLCAAGGHSGYAHSGAEGALEELLRRATAQYLHEDAYWRVLVHYRRSLGRWQSRVDDPDFFLAPKGKTDPRAELEATLRALFSIPVEGQPHAADRFPARAEWLRSRLGIDPSSLPVVESAEFEQIWQQLDPDTACLVFPTSYMNSPASMFGHTLITIESRRQSELLNHAVNYAALTEETNGLIFAFKGIFGLYKGFYSIMPYYQKVQEYSDINQRDMWEYELAFTVPEVRRMLMHIWELRDIYSHYYFFDENCSYNLLFLLDAARPGLALHTQTRPWVIPLDTIKLVEEAGLVARVRYRPSKATRVRHMAAEMAPPLQVLAAEVADGATPADRVLSLALGPASKARVLELAAESLQCRRGKKRIGKDDFAVRFIDVLGARSSLGQLDDADVQIPQPVPPHTGHRSMRLGVGFGTEANVNFAELSLRPAYHDLTDPDEGYLDGSQIDFMSLSVRYYDSRRRWEVHRLDLLRIRSLAPRCRMFQPISWKVDAGLVRERADDRDLARYLYLTAGGGWTWSQRHVGLYYTLLETELRTGTFDVNYAAGLGGSVGLVKRFGTRCKLHLYGRAMGYALGNRHHELDIGCEKRLTLTANNALAVKLSRRKTWDHYETLAALQFLRYF